MIDDELIDSNTVYPIYKIAILEPPFDGDIGWLSMTELNLLDPFATRFNVICDMQFESGDLFVLIERSC
jgi:hypothetical protein